MNEQRDDGGTAFPINCAIGPSGDVYTSEEGMTLRDWFAGQAMPFAAGNTSWPKGYDGRTGSDDWKDGRRIWTAAVARDAYAIADAMLAERSKP